MVRARIEESRKGSSLRVISAAHPAPTELAARLQCSGELWACVRLRAAVLLAPSLGVGLPLSGASVEETESATWDLSGDFYQYCFS